MKKTFLFMAIACWLSTSFAQTTLTEAVDFCAEDIGGAPWTLFDALNNKQYVCLFFYSVDCQFCQDAAPFISDVYQYYGCNQAQLMVLGINHQDSKEEVSKFEEDYDLSCPSISGLEENGGSICELYDIQAHPTIILIAPDKKILETDIWPIPNTDFLIGLLESYGMVHQPCGADIHFDVEYHGWKIYVGQNNQLFVCCQNYEQLMCPQVSMWGVYGNQVLQESLRADKQQFNLSSIPDGCSVVVISDKGKKIHSQKILINQRQGN